jgi:hypothetical protein
LATSLDGHDLQLTGSAHDLDADAVGLSLESQVDRRTTDREVVDLEVIEEVGQSGVIEAERSRLRVCLESEARLEQHEYGA